jgi:NAD(P)-dependent dehydrogenase (short-subunit alcohol dehydrogenase family)
VTATGGASIDKSLAGQVAVVAGAGSSGPGVGVGKAISVVLAQQGARLLLVDVSAEFVAETAAMVSEAGAEAAVYIGDLADPEACEGAIRRAVDEFGTVDVVINNAAISGRGTVVSLTEAHWQEVLSVTLMGAVHMSRYAVPVMQAGGGGSIVNISSICGSRGYGQAAYAAAKGGLEALTRDMAVAHGRDGIRVNAVVPGHISTPRVAPTPGAAQGLRPGDLTTRTAASPLGTEGTAWDVAWAVEFLASPRSRWITGVSLPVDGGVLATSYISMQMILADERGEAPQA